ncbi:MAG: FkbM family methyltransferase [Phycisphaerae bacterium]
MPDELGEFTPRELRALAERCAWLRPLGPCPGWRFSSDWENPATAFRLRRLIWEHCRTHGLALPVVVPWHGATRLRLHLGNDLSQALFVGGCYEPNEFAFLARVLRPGMSFVDVGANDGVYALPAAAWVGAKGRVFAFEPSRRELSRLRANLRLNPAAARVEARGLALGDATGSASLTIAEETHAGQNTLGAFAYADVAPERTERVRVMTLDAFAAEQRVARIDVLKLDAEGAEERILRGAEGVLRTLRPTLLLELSDAALRRQSSGSASVVRFLAAHAYDVYTFDDATGRPRRAPRGPWSDNVVASPRERPVAAGEA